MYIIRDYIVCFLLLSVSPPYDGGLGCDPRFAGFSFLPASNRRSVTHIDHPFLSSRAQLDGTLSTERNAFQTRATHSGVYYAYELISMGYNSGVFYPSHQLCPSKSRDSSFRIVCVPNDSTILHRSLARVCVISCAIASV